LLLLLLVCTLLCSQSFGFEAILVYGDEQSDGIRDEWLQAIKSVSEELQAYFRENAATRITYFFNSETLEKDMTTAKIVAGPNVHTNVKTNVILDTINAKSRIGDLLLVMFGHGMIGTGAVDMNGGRLTPKDGVSPLSGSKILDNVNGAHNTVVVHTSCYGGSAWKNAAATMVRNKVFAFTFEQDQPADGTVALAMARWLVPHVLCNGLYSTMNGGQSSLQGIDSKTLSTFKRTLKLSDFDTKFKAECSKYYLTSPGRRGPRHCFSYPPIVDTRVFAGLLPEREC